MANQVNVQQRENLYKVSRPVYSEESFAEQFQFNSQNNLSSNRPQNARESFKKITERVFAGCFCHGRKMEWLRERVPIIDWLPKYSLKQDGFADLCGGLTVGVMHVPQGLAFAMLASLPPVTGLYTSLIPVFIYMILGTSRYLSKGAMPVVCIMVAQVVNREIAKINEFEPLLYNNSTTDPTPLESVWSPIEAKKLEIATSLTLLIGFIQAAMGFLKLGFIAGYLSDPVISGFTTGAVVVIITSQIKPILGLNFLPASGFFSIIKTITSIFTNITSSNVGSIITGILCIAILIGLKHINERYNKKLPFPVPGELLVVVLSTAISYGGQLNAKFDIQIVKNIPKGMPPISIPSLELMNGLFSDAFKIAIVIFATNISVAKLFAKKNRQKVDSNQELIAYGACNVGVSLFSGFPVSIAIARVVVQENLARTQLCSIPAIVVLLLVLLFIAHLFFHLPKAVLAAIVIANLLGILKQFSRIKRLWIICKADAIVWCATCFGVILLGIDVGLGCGVFAAFMSIVLRSSKPRYSILGNIPNTDIYRDVKDNPKAKDLYGIKIVRFESFLYYANVEYFKDVLHSTVFVNGCTKDVLKIDEKHRSDELHGSMKDVNKTFALPISLCTIHTVIVDASTFTCIDSMGIEALSSIIRDFNKSGIQLYLANCSRFLRKQLARSGVMDDHLRDLMFVSINDAVLHSRLTISQQMTETRC